MTPSPLQPVENNSFNPVWNEEIAATVHVPSLAHVRFAILDDRVNPDKADGHFMAQCSLPLSLLQPGFRRLVLEADNSALSATASLFIHVSWELNSEGTSKKTFGKSLGPPAQRSRTGDSSVDAHLDSIHAALVAGQGAVTAFQSSKHPVRC